MKQEHAGGCSMQGGVGEPDVNEGRLEARMNAPRAGRRLCFVPKPTYCNTSYNKCSRNVGFVFNEINVGESS